MATVSDTKTWTPEEIVEWVNKSDEQVKKALLKLYALQTADEQQIEETKHKNGVGFSACHADILTSFSKQLLSRRFLSKKQIVIVRKILPHYRKQLANIANGLM